VCRHKTWEDASSSTGCISSSEPWGGTSGKGKQSLVTNMQKNTPPAGVKGTRERGAGREVGTPRIRCTSKRKKPDDLHATSTEQGGQHQVAGQPRRNSKKDCMRRARGDDKKGLKDRWKCCEKGQRRQGTGEY